MPSLFSSLPVQGMRNTVNMHKPLVIQFIQLKPKGSSVEEGLDCPCFYPRPLCRTVYVKDIHWHSLYAIELRSSAFSSAVNIWNLVGIPFGVIRRKRACQRDERE